jgi:hypothetical protein
MIAALPFLLCAIAFVIGVVAFADVHDQGVRAEQDRLDAEFTAWVATCHCDECERDRAVFRRSA